MRLLVQICGASLFASTAYADEGMWPYDMVPPSYGLDAAWLEKAMGASVRFNTASASFVSPSGLLLTNHHVGSDCIQQLALMDEGFVAKTQEEEKRCPSVELAVLRAIEDVTQQVLTSTRGAGSEQAQQLRNAEIARIEKKCTRSSGLYCSVVVLWSGGAYHLYKYKRYTDVRLVFAPELSVAYFGGDRDNFTYPRFCLDVALFRAYENEAPVKTDAHFRLSKAGPSEGDTLYISGHPKTTDRFAPVSKLEMLHSIAYPFLLERYAFERDSLRAFSAKGPREEKAARDELLGVENVIKATTGYQGGLSDRALMDEARKREVLLLAKLRALNDKKQHDHLLAAWPKLEPAYRRYGEIYREHAVLEKPLSPGGHLAEFARHLLRHAQQMEKKNELRLPEYRDSNLARVESTLFAQPPIDRELEAELIAAGLSNIATVLGKNHAVVKKMLKGERPLARARKVVDRTKLHDVQLRRRMWRGGSKAIQGLKDPVIELVAAYDSHALEIRRQYEDEVESVERTYYGRIAEAYRIAVGSAVYPDATNTLRINQGKAIGYGAEAWHTTFAGMFAKYDEAKGEPPYQLPERWLRARASLDLSTPFDFVTTNDIIAGSSGSPILAADGKLAGVIFDGNLAQLPNRFLYRETEARAIGVHPRAILHALSKIYDAEHLVQELTR